MAMKMRVLIGVLLCAIGVVIMLQGVDLVHGSKMSGETQWVVVGAGGVLVGLANLAIALRTWRRRTIR
jgi:hypothetical protein